MLLISRFIETPQERIDASSPDLELVRKFALKKDLGADDVWLGRMHLCNDRYDRMSERIPPEYLARIAATAPGKAVLGGHDTRSLPLARMYDARVVKDGQNSYVQADYFVNLGTQRGRDLASDIEAGVLKDVSVTATCGPRLCDVCGAPSKPSKFSPMPVPGCEHTPGQMHETKKVTATYDPGFAHLVETREASFVFCGAQYGAEALARGMWTPEYPLNVELYRQLISIQPEIERASFTISGLTHSTPAAAKGDAMFDTLEKAVAEIERLQKLPLSGERETELQKAISDLNGRVEPLEKQVNAARDWQFGEIRRMAGIVGETRLYEKLLAKATNDTWEELEPLRVELAAKVNQKLGPVDPQGSANGPGDDEEEKPKPSWKDRLQGGYF